ncbi:MAG: hypothetical protein A2099_03490 [Planctomycetes bacterium GWF2_39_10]|nr:MAG: hypothetical protein A2Y11_06660 [Planctomycetes bacterium GWC2_39_26]OHB46230.1 MAG: hypothetical protein A2099_03490 [Planctomycetes bacterium GWF2_39_10]OHC00651.1 MAG: hypothetical protein A3G70_04940 [Planctomycetes bacterium RIFCSPLOWO2_12_FULL_39_13]
MRNMIFAGIFALCNTSSIVFGQFYDYDVPEIKLKSGLPSVFAVDSVRQISEGTEESVLNVCVTVKKGKIESVSRDGGCWIVTVRTSSKEASTYLIKDSQFKILGEESKKVIVNAIHWKDGN